MAAHGIVSSLAGLYGGVNFTQPNTNIGKPSNIVNKVDDIAGKGKGSRKDNTTGKVNQVKPQVLDPIYANDTWKPIKRFELVQKDGVWYTVGNNGTMFRARGTYDYVTINGKIYVSKTSSPGQDVGHFDISRGAKQVDYAGSVQFGWNSGTRGVLKGFDNSSGHYKPSANDAHQSGFPLDKFKGIYDVK